MDDQVQQLELKANDQGWRLFLVRRNDSTFEKFAQKIFQRDHYTCQYCGFASLKFQEIINLDCDYASNKVSNLVTACQFCAQCHFIQAIGQNGFGGGILISLPELTQIQLNALAHATFSDLVNSPSRYAHAKNVYRELKLMAKPLESKLGEGMSSPGLYGQLLIENASKKMKDLHQSLASSIRLLPRLEKFTHLIQDYSIQAYRELSQ
jgi:intracellular multiplication protein IcmJ